MQTWFRGKKVVGKDSGGMDISRMTGSSRYGIGQVSEKWQGEEIEIVEFPLLIWPGKHEYPFRACAAQASKAQVYDGSGRCHPCMKHSPLGDPRRLVEFTASGIRGRPGEP